MTRPPMLAADHIRELVKPFTTVEHVDRIAQDNHGTWRKGRGLHAVHHPSLLDQLEEAVTGASALADEDAGKATFTSKPAARVEAMDVLAMIEAESLDVAVDLELQDPPRTVTRVPVEPLRERLLAISGKVGMLEDPRVKRWWIAARVTTQWESRPFHPKGAPCPMCWEVSSLRVTLSEELARCVECRHDWDGAGFRVLAQHVRWCTDHEVTKARHWIVDDEGFPVECVECLSFRDAFAEVRLLRAQERAKAEAARLAGMTRPLSRNA